MNEQDNPESERFVELTRILQYDSCFIKKLTDFDRMFLHKERAAIIGGTNWKIPKYLENKVQAINRHIEQINWMPPDEL